MSGFLNQSPFKSKKLHEPIYKNAQKLKKDAVLLAKENKSYCTATSLLVLSSEEVIKAILVILHSEGLSVYRVKAPKKFFTDHKIRHELAKMIELGSSLFESAKKYEENEPSTLFRLKNDTWNIFLNGLVDIINASKPLLDSYNNFEELNQFDAYKQKGFYVDFVDELIVPSKQIDESKFIKTNNITDRLFKFYKGLRIIYNPRFKNHFNENEIIELQNQLKVLINEGMYEFSFNNK